MNLHYEERYRLAGACVKTAGIVGAAILGLAIRELPYFRAVDWIGWLPLITFAVLIQWIIAYVWGCFIKTFCVTSEEIVSTTKHGNWRHNSSWRIPISSITAASMVEHGTTAVRGDSGRPVIHQEPGDVRGVRLVLKDGSSRFIAFEYPAKALAAIQEAMNTSAAR